MEPIVTTSAVASGAFPFATTLLVFLLVGVRLAVSGGLIYLFVLLVKALRKYLKSNEVRKENAVLFRNLGEALKENRIRCKMTQEFVAEHLGVSRQAVSKWENGTSDPSTANLLALAKLYGINPADLLRQIQE